MPDAKTILDVLEGRDPQTIGTHLDPNKFDQKKFKSLTGRFKAIVDEDNPEVADCKLEDAVNDLLRVFDNEYAASLLDQAEEASEESGLDGEGTMRPSKPVLPDLIKIKERANRYYNLLTKLKKMAQAKGRQ